MRFMKKAVVGILSSLLLLTAIGPSQAAETASMDANPGPVGDFAWEGFNWNKRVWGGGPHFNGKYDAANVAAPDANGHVKLSLTNPTGTAPIAAEFQSTRRGFGYGTYSTVVEKNVASLQKEVVWGCLFTYDPDASPSFNEIDLCEASAWGGGGEWGQSWPIEQGHGYWIDANKGPGVGNNTVTFPVNDSPVMTHKMVWEPGKITFESFSGEGYNGQLLKRTVIENANIPVPAKEHVIFNLWVTGGGGGKPQQVKPEHVIIRGFSFVPAGTTPNVPSCANLKLGDAWAGVGTHCKAAGNTTAESTNAGVATSSPTPTTTPVQAAKAKPSATATVPSSPATAPVPSESTTAVPAPSPSSPPASAVSTPAPAVQKVAPPAVSEGIQLSHLTTKGKKQKYTTNLRWGGAVGSTVTVIANGSKKTVSNTGEYLFSSSRKTSTYQICDASGCSDELKVSIP